MQSLNVLIIADESSKALKAVLKSKYLNKTNHIKGNNLEEVSLKEFLVHLQEQLQRPTNQFIFD